MNTVAEEVERYMRTGDTDPKHLAWPGGFMERANRAHEDLRRALVEEVQRLAEGRVHAPLPTGDLVLVTRTRVEPMVRGLFPRVEQAVVLATLEKSVVFLTSTSIDEVLLTEALHRSAWDLANLYLSGVGAKLLGEDAPSIVGLSQDTTCFVSPEYFSQDDQFADFVVHEAAHIFHNCKRHTLGLRETRAREWLLDVQFQRRETFAYSCEAYSCVLRRAKGTAERLTLADEYARVVQVPDLRVDSAEVADIVREAVRSRNGWKAILRRCAPPSRSQVAFA